MELKFTPHKHFTRELFRATVDGKRQKGQKYKFHLPSVRFVFICCRFCYNHLPPTLIEPPARFPFHQLPTAFSSYLSERLCAHHQFKWFSLSTAFHKYLPESEEKESIIALWNRRVFPIIMPTLDLRPSPHPHHRHSNATHNSTARSNRRANERAAHEQQQKRRGKISVAGEEKKLFSFVLGSSSVWRRVVLCGGMGSDNWKCIPETPQAKSCKNLCGNAKYEARRKSEQEIVCHAMAQQHEEKNWLCGSEKLSLVKLCWRKALEWTDDVFFLLFTSHIVHYLEPGKGKQCKG